MSNLLRSLLRGAGGEASAHSPLGRWRQAVSAEIGGDSAQILWRPGTPTTEKHVETWAEVYAAIQATESRITVLVDSTLAAPTIPAGLYDLESRVEFAANAVVFAFAGVPQFVSLDDGAQLRDLFSIREGFRVETHQTTAPALLFSDIAILYLKDGGALDNQGTGPAIRVTSGNSLALMLHFQCSLATSTEATVDIESGGTLVVFSQDGNQFYDGVFSGVIGSTLLYFADDTFVPPVLPDFFGSYGFVGRSSQAASATPAAGPSGSRPSGPVPSGPLEGQMYADTTLGKPIWWIGGMWVDATGAPA